MKLWEIYTLDTPDEKIIASFQAKYGRPPTEVWRDGTIAHAGPITSEEHQRKVKEYLEEIS